MKREVANIAFSVVTLAIFAAFEELLPKPFGAGVPLLICACIWRGVRKGATAAMLFAAAAGAAEDSLGMLPFATSAAFFAGTVAVAKVFVSSGRSSVPAGLPCTVALAASSWCLYQLWLWIWLGGRMEGSVFSRMLVAAPVAAATAAAAIPFLSFAAGKAGLDDES